MPTDKEKADFKQFMRKMFKELNPKTVSSFDGDEPMTVVVTRAVDFNEDDNDYWELEGNKSYRRDIKCDGCGEVVAMSNETFRMYGEAEAKPTVKCMACFAKENGDAS